MPYLIDQLKNLGAPLDFKFIGRSELLTKPKKDGGTYKQYDYTFKIGDKIVNEGIFEKTHDVVLIKAQEGDMCRASVDKSGNFVSWMILPRGDDILKIANPSNYESIKAEKTYEGTLDKQEVKSIQIALQGYAQAFISSGREDMQDNDYVLAQAEVMLRKTMIRAQALAQDDTFPPKL